MEGKLHINTTAVHGGGRKDDCFGAAASPRATAAAWCWTAGPIRARL